MTLAKADIGASRGTGPEPSGARNLLLRVASALVLAPLAVFVAYLGGYVFLAFWTIVALGVIWEWDKLVCAHDRNSVLAIGGAALVGAAALLTVGRQGTALSMIALAAIGIGSLASRVRRSWCALGAGYAGAMLIAPVLLRHDTTMGFTAIMFLFVIVWLTDIAAYFVGRTVGGPKLMPRVSPKKTWSGAIGGAIAGVAGGLALAHWAGIGNPVAIGLLAFLLSVVGQAGDLFESALKRRFNAKDSSSLLPGHGGLMDRLDGFVAAATVAAILGFVRGGFDAPAHGLLIW